MKKIPNTLEEPWEKARRDYIARMKKLQELPPPTLEKVIAQWKTSVEFTNKIKSYAHESDYQK